MKKSNEMLNLTSILSTQQEFESVFTLTKRNCYPVWKLIVNRNKSEAFICLATRAEKTTRQTLYKLFGTIKPINAKNISKYEDRIRSLLLENNVNV